MFETEVADGSQQFGFQQEVAEPSSVGMEQWVSRGATDGMNDDGDG